MALFVAGDRLSANALNYRVIRELTLSEHTERSIMTNHHRSTRTTRDRIKRFVSVNLSLVLAAVVLLGTATSSASASSPELDEVEQPSPSTPDPDVHAQSWPGRSCTFRAEAHDPHRSGNDASGHGNWVNTSNPRSHCPSKAFVTVKLQAWLCMDQYPYTCKWVTQATRAHWKYSGQQVAVHFPCTTSQSASWRTYTKVKVPISGWFDKYDTATNEKVVRCSL